ncbi:MAG: NAD(P)-dependent oxidoreductase [Rhodospirillales bacterium]|nr:NAD(P)-dependent oxidoreductase [Rhodospirillales bacterium]
MAETIGFIGLGSMGAGMAKRLLDAGYGLNVYNRTADKADPLVEAGATRSETPGAATPTGGIVMTMLADDRALEHVVFGDNGVLAGLGAGGLHVSFSTVAPATAQRLAEAHAERGATYLAAPVFGRPDAAAAGKLWVVTSGADAAKQRARPPLEALSQGIVDFGEDIGAANTVKLTGNFLIIAAMEAMAEAFAMAEKRGIDRIRLADLFASTLFDCPIYRNYGRMIAERRYTPVGFTVALGLKDVRLVLDAARGAEAPMPLASLVHDRLLALQAQGHGAIDWSGLALAASREAGLG